jgi:hypothetical protein
MLLIVVPALQLVFVRKGRSGDGPGRLSGETASA